ncbi:MFS transporter [Malacoplasma penetrans]|uniref:MFS transporter n=1 Tax=Malacoplasma penetrans TaxID=28227 RepID=UPI00101047AB|nr:MFS transporter [Malacoplasma penetrans]RXY96508.1 MFS transporter [Malacoplasma penetrans]
MKNLSFGFKNKDTKSINQKTLTLMWSLMFLGYLLFVLQWYSIINFGSGWGQAFFENNRQSILVSSVPNWMITFGRSIGSILAGYFIAKLGHKYAVVFCLTLMVVSFPFIIIAQNQSWNSLSIAGGASITHDGVYGTAVLGFSLFVIFRVFLAIGGTTLIVYTNSVIAKMNQNKKSKYIASNTFGLNIGTILANVFFIIPEVRSAVTNNYVWTIVLSIPIILISLISIIYLLFGIEVVAKDNKSQTEFTDNKKHTIKSVLKIKENYSLYCIFGIYLFSLVFSTGSGFRNFIEQSPANVAYLISVNQTSIASGYYAFVWPLFICVLMFSYVASAFTLTKFNKTSFNRKTYIATLLGTGMLFLLIAYLVVYFFGYSNYFALFFFYIFTFIAGAFLWGAQPIIFYIPQQQKQADANYVGTTAGLAWGIGYLLYTLLDASLSSIATYVVEEQFSNKINNALSNPNYSYSINTGPVIMFVLFWIILLFFFVCIYFLPSTGYKKDNQFIEFKNKWNPLNINHWKFKNFYI